MSDPLKLRAVDADDLAVLSAVLQDALVPVHDMQFLAGESSFVLVANRFCWERLDRSGANAGPFERVHCAIRFDRVRRVQTLGFSPTRPEDRERLLEVLAITGEDDELILHFAGGLAVRLETAGIAVIAQDMDEPWPTLWRPEHPLGGEGA